MVKIFIFTALFVFLSFPGLFANQGDSLIIYIAGGDSAYAGFDNESALKFFRKAYVFDSTSYEAVWKLARAYVDVGEAINKKDMRKKYYQQALKYALRATEIDSNSAKGFLWASIAVGRVALDAGKKEQVRLSKEVKKYVDRALALDPNDDIAWHVLGRWNRKMATLGWLQRKFANIFLGGLPKDASLDSAVKCFHKALEINPDDIRHHLELGITYEKQKQKQLAKEEYEKVLQLPEKDSDDAELKKEAAERLNKIR